jgi:hypothetical protein
VFGSVKPFWPSARDVRGRTPMDSNVVTVLPREPGLTRYPESPRWSVVCRILETRR